MSSIALRVVRSSAIALLSSAIIETASAAGPAAPLAAPFLAENAAPTAASASPTRVVVTPSGHRYLVLSVVPEARDGAVTCDVLYLAGEETVELARPGARERLAAAAAELVTAFAPLVEVGPVERLSISAMFGKPGRSGAVERLWFARREGAWRAQDGAGERVAAPVPPAPASIFRDAEKEASAHATASGFIADADRADYDAAWEKTSAIVKAAMSRTEFERSLSELTRSSGGADGELILSFPVVAGGFLPGATVEAWMSRPTAEGPIVEALALRLDDDLRWRVAAVVQLTRTASGAGASAAAGAKPPAVDAASSL